MKSLFPVIITLVISASSIFSMSGCSTDAQVVSRNLSIEAGMFNLNRRVIFYNGITGNISLRLREGAKLSMGLS